MHINSLLKLHFAKLSHTAVLHTLIIPAFVCQMKLLHCQTCTLFLFTGAWLHLPSSIKGARGENSKHSTRRALILAGGQWGEAGIDHFQRRLFFGVWLHLPRQTRCAARTAGFTCKKQKKQMFKVRGACRADRTF